MKIVVRRMIESISLFNGFIGLVFFTYAAGFYVQAYLGKTEIKALNYIELIGVSFYISWVVVFISFFINLGDISLFLYVPLIIYLM